MGHTYGYYQEKAMNCQTIKEIKHTFGILKMGLPHEQYITLCFWAWGYKGKSAPLGDLELPMRKILEEEFGKNALSGRLTTTEAIGAFLNNRNIHTDRHVSIYEKLLMA